MRVSVRACLLAGVTLIGASAIAFAPVQVAPPNVRVSAERPTTTRFVSDARVEFLAAVRQMAPPSAAVTADPVPLNAASDAIINAWNAALPWIDYGVNLTDYVLGFIPYGYLIGDQISIVYYSLIRPVANSFVVNLVAPVVNDPLNPASYVNGLATVGSVTVTSLINLGINEFNYFFGWLIPPIPPLPLATAAEATTEAEPEATAETAEGIIETADETDPPTAEEGPDIQTMVAVDETTDTDETVGRDTEDIAESEVDATIDTTPTTSTFGTVQAQGEVRGTGDQAPPDETTTVPAAGDNTADAGVETEPATTPEPTSEHTDANPDNIEAGSG
jgi:hypothetical protein